MRPVRPIDRGMTLVEIMITLVISSIVAASTFMFFAGQQRIYDTQTKVLNIQQNLWAAMEVLARYTRAAGSGMYECVRPASYADATAADGSRLLSTSPSPGPLTPNLSAPPATGVRAYSSTNGMQFIPPLWIVDNSQSDAGVVQNTDIITVALGNRTSGTDTDAALALNVTDTISPIVLMTANGSNMFRNGEFILLLTTPNTGYGTNPTNDRGCTMFQVTDWVGNSTNLWHSASGGSANWNPPGNQAGMLAPGGGYTAGSAGVRNFGTFTWVRFFIQLDANGIPNLMFQQLDQGGSAQVLAEGIEDLQVSFACDTGTLGSPNLGNLNGVLDEGSTDPTMANDEWWNNVPNDNLPRMNTAGYCNVPTAIRLTLVARSLSPDDLINPTLTGNGPLNVENHRPNPTTDRYRRRILSTTVYPRNNKPL